MSHKHYEGIDTLRGFAVFLMILGHAVASGSILNNDVVWCENMYDFIYRFHMPLFFVIAGFCYRRCTDYKEYFIKRIKRLLVPYIVFSTASILMRNIFSAFTLNESNVKEDLLSILFNGADIWFLYVMFEISIIFPLLDLINRDNKHRWNIYLISLIALGFVLRDTEIFLVNRMIYDLFFFSLGVCFKTTYPAGIRKYCNRQKEISNYHFSNFICTNMVVYTFRAIYK